MRHDSDWNHYRFRYGDGQQARVEFDVGCALFTPGTHDRCVRIRTAQPEQIERRLASLGASVWLVGRMHYADACTLVLQCEDESPVLEQLPDAALEVSEGWGFFDERVCPTDVDWRRISDREQLEALVRGGLDPLEPREVAHRFYGAEAGLPRLKSVLEAVGVRLISESGGRLEVGKVHPPAVVSEVSVPLMRCAGSQGFAYDGWSLLDVRR